MNQITILDAESARDLIADYGGPHGFGTAWLLGHLPEEVKESFRASADALGMRRWVEVFDHPGARTRHERLVKAANCLVEGRPTEGSWTEYAQRGEPGEVLETFRQRLTDLLSRVGIEPPAQNEAEECRLALY